MKRDPDQPYYPESGDDFYWDPLDEPIHDDEGPTYSPEWELEHYLAFEQAWRRRRRKERQQQDKKDFYYALLFVTVFLLIATSSSWCRWPAP